MVAARGWSGSVMALTLVRRVLAIIDWGGWSRVSVIDRGGWSRVSIIDRGGWSRISIHVDIGMTVGVGVRHGDRYGDVASRRGFGLGGGLLSSCTLIQECFKQLCVPVVALVQKVDNISEHRNKSTLERKSGEKNTRIG